MEGVIFVCCEYLIVIGFVDLFVCDVDGVVIVVEIKCCGDIDGVE